MTKKSFKLCKYWGFRGEFSPFCSVIDSDCYFKNSYKFYLCNCFVYKCLFSWHLLQRHVLTDTSTNSLEAVLCGGPENPHIVEAGNLERIRDMHIQAANSAPASSPERSLCVLLHPQLCLRRLGITPEVTQGFSRCWCSDSVEHWINQSPTKVSFFMFCTVNFLQLLISSCSNY